MGKSVRVRDEAAGSEARSAALPGSEAMRASGCAERARLPADTVVHGKFRVLAAAQSGGDELAFKALHLGTGRRVELRLLSDAASADGPEAERMLRAARAAGRAPHGNLLNVVDSGLDPTHGPFVVYEQFSGIAANELLTERGPCELAMAVEITCQVLDGLAALHARGVYHRNLRPESVLIARDGEDTRVKLVGLGYAVHAARDTDAPELPRGYSRYLAPEARRGEASSTASIDLYAAGVLLRFLLTGSAVPEHTLPAPIERAIARATADDPDERFPSAEHFHASVRASVGSSAQAGATSGGLPADLRYLLQRREIAKDESAARDARPLEDGRLELYPTLLIIESLYARVGALGWAALLERMPEIERLLPAAGLTAQHRRAGVASSSIAAMLKHVDAFSGQDDLVLIAELGEELARRGLGRFCAALPAQLTPEGLIACVPVLWRSLARDGDVITLEQRDQSARLGVRGQRHPSLELTALFAGMLRGQLRLVASAAEVNLVAAEALGEEADVYVLGW